MTIRTAAAAAGKLGQTVNASDRRPALLTTSTAATICRSVRTAIALRVAFGRGVMCGAFFASRAESSSASC
jgi:hypothetical protein